MCGIAGIAAFSGARPPSEPQIRAMCDTIIHRGPDDEGIDIRDSVALGMRRLSIIDLTGGRQPVFNEDRSVRAVFNGEIYNFRELRSALEQRGHKFTSSSDTEVLVHGYEEWGTGLPEHLNGMFAFAIHDSGNHRLMLARDHLGVKPLFYHFNGRHLVWGSEIKAILASNLVERQLDYDSLAELLSWEYVPGQGTLFTNIKKLEPGYLVDIDLGQPACHPRQYWDIPLSADVPRITEQDWADRVAEKIRECVQRQLVSDVPLGAFLSGGVDSSLVVSGMEQAETFSIGFNDPTYNELEYARRVADHLGVKHTFEIIESDVADLFEHLMRFMDDPIGDFSIFPTYLVSRLARRHVTVALSGDGGDELFGGYDNYVADKAARYYSLVPRILRRGIISPLVNSLPPRPEKKGFINKLKRFVEGADLPERLSHSRWRLFAPEAFCAQLLTEDALQQMTRSADHHIDTLFERAGQRSALERSLYVDVKSYLSDNCLVKLDRMSMANSLESRVPMLDKELVELAFEVPDELKLKGSRTKILLKQIAAEQIPAECVYRQKEGFSIPIKHWLGTQFRPILDDLLDEGRLKAEGIFKVNTVGRLKQEHFAGRANHSHVLWSMMVFQAWRRLWLDAA
ncbi:MAG: asparagine synthase (glutamine-hydrolyzing) [Gammaproteobacteria bacterium]|nr:asparagine synthase (glutamine-hydrolyzing) [Gammaproteobacteria bacterium]